MLSYDENTILRENICASFETVVGKTDAYMHDYCSIKQHVEAYRNDHCQLRINEPEQIIIFSVLSIPQVL